MPTVLEISPALFRKLHAPVGGGVYALGWGIGHMPWSAGPVLQHDGSNGLFYATVFAAPKESRIFLVVANRGGDAAERATYEVVDYLAAAKPAAEAKRPAR